MSTIQIPARIPLDDYSSVIGAGEVAELRTLAKPLAGRSVVMINSTAVGGGVAEIVNRLVPLAEELGINIRWEVMTGGEDFFDVPHRNSIGIRAVGCKEGSRPGTEGNLVLRWDLCIW